MTEQISTFSAGSSTLQSELLDKLATLKSKKRETLKSDLVRAILASNIQDAVNAQFELFQMEQSFMRLEDSVTEYYPVEN